MDLLEEPVFRHAMPVSFVGPAGTYIDALAVLPGEGPLSFDVDKRVSKVLSRMF